jgi:hypothetical protein
MKVYKSIDTASHREWEFKKESDAVVKMCLKSGEGEDKIWMTVEEFDDLYDFLIRLNKEQGS